MIIFLYLTQGKLFFLFNKLKKFLNRLYKKKKMNISDILIEKLRKQCLMRGVSGIKSLSKVWIEIDEDWSNDLTFEEFQLGLNNLDIKMNLNELKQLFKLFELKDSGRISYKELLVKLRVNNFVCFYILYNIIIISLFYFLK